MLEHLLDAAVRIASPEVALAMIASAVYGLFVGSVPGLTATMAVALLVPFTFFMSDVAATASIVTLTATAIFAGDIPGALVRIPGTPSSAAYTSDGYALTKQGRHGEALTASLVGSVVGGLLGSLILIVAARQLSKIATLFTSYENFWLVVLGLTCAAVVSQGSPLKGAFSLVIGLFAATIGLSEVHAAPRFTFGVDEMIGGVNFIPAMIGLFGGSEVLRLAVHGRIREAPPEKPPAATRGLLADFAGQLRRTWARRGAALRSGSMGTIVGMLPGAGADIAAWMSYAVSRKRSKHPEEYGRGSLDGIADGTGANNAALAGAWIPALVFGIPGDSVTAIVIGVLMMKNITPGPQIFEDPQRAVFVYSIYLAFILANLLMIPLGLLAIRTGSLVIRVPRNILAPAILLICLVGSYAINGSYFDVSVMLALAILGFVLEEFAVPLAPLVLGIILGGRLEQTLIQSLIKSNDLSAFVTRPVSLVLALVCAWLWISPFFRRRRGAGESSVE